MKTKKNINIILLLFIFSINLLAQQRSFSEWDATAFCSTTKYHPFTYIKADNNWEIIQALQTPQTRQYLDSLGIKNTDSQMMLLRIEGLISQEKDNKWVSLMPILDSLQTVDARIFSSKVANDLYPKIKNECCSLVNFLKQEKCQENIYSILFSYVLDGEIWKSFNSFKDLKSSATWDGECWVLYYPRELSAGTNSHKEFNFCWSDKEPEFVYKELYSENFIDTFLEEYKNKGKIISPDIHEKALSLGIIHEDGTPRLPVIDSNDNNSMLNIISNQIIDTIVLYFTNSDIISVFQSKFKIDPNKKKLACTMLYHEVMWDLMDLLIKDRIIQYPILWRDMKKASTYSVVFIKN